jgi:hypothetical protein
MPSTFDIDPARRRITVTCTGSYDADEALVAMREFAARPDLDPAFGLLVDVRQLAYVASFDDLILHRDGFLELRASFRGPIAVVGPDLLRYGIARSASGLLGRVGIRMEVFRDIAEAEAWLAAETPPA